MKAYKDYVVTPVGSRYNNIKKIGKKELILNTEVSNHQYINRLAKVVSTPMLFDSPIEVGDDIIVHHNVFRRWYNIRGEEKNSRSYLDDNKYIVSGDQVFLYKKDIESIRFYLSRSSLCYLNKYMVFSSKNQVINFGKAKLPTFSCLTKKYGLFKVFSWLLICA